LGIGEPSVQRRFIPDDGCLLQRVRVGKLRVLSRIAAVYAAQRGPDFCLVEGMAAGASFFESVATTAGILYGSRERNACVNKASEDYQARSQSRICPVLLHMSTPFAGSTRPAANP